MVQAHEQQVFATILAGGSGTRLWPLSRQAWPKQLLALTGKNTLIQETARRIHPVIPTDHQIIITSNDYIHQIQSQMADLFGAHSPRTLAEPIAKNTAPAILWAASLARALGGKDAILAVLASDHLITAEQQFQHQLAEAISCASQGRLVTFGIKPTHPETGYGYIEAGEAIPGGTACSVRRFVEKPDRAKAEEYVQSGNFSWNSGMFILHVQTLFDETRKTSPALAALFENLDPTNAEAVKDAFMKSPSISIDFAVMEKAGNVAVIQGDFGWSDVGSWMSLFDASPKDQVGNVVMADHIGIDTNECLIVGKNRTIATIGVKNLAIIDTPDALLVCPLSESQRVKEIVARLKKDHRPEIREHATAHRPWGTYTVLEEGDRYKIKRIEVYPGKRLSLQRHAHRSEHWVVVSGTALVRNGEEEFFIRENHSTYIQATQMHRLSNPGKIPLQIIEIQAGSYLEEDDIERFDDDWGRGDKNS